MTRAGLSPMRRALAAALLATVGGLAVAGGAQAQYFDREIDAVLPPRAVVWRLSRQGFTTLSHPRFDGAAYVVEAQSPWGNRVRLFVDARSGAILERERVEAPLYPPGRVGPPPGYGWTEDEVVEAPRPTPRVARPATASVPDAVPTNPFASNYPSRTPTRAEVAAANPPSLREPAPVPMANATGSNPQGLNPDRLGSGAGSAPRRTEPRRTAKLVPPRSDPAAAARPAEAAPTPPQPTPAAAAAPASAVVAQAPKPSAPPARDAAEPQRPVRVIGGITPVPGVAGKPEAKAAGE